MKNVLKLLYACTVSVWMTCISVVCVVVTLFGFLSIAAKRPAKREKADFPGFESQKNSVLTEKFSKLRSAARE